MNTSPASRQRGFALWVYIAVLIGTAGAAFVVLMLYQNIVARKAEATKDVFRVVEVSDQTVDPATWGKNYPRQYDSYKRTVDIERTQPRRFSEAIQKLDRGSAMWRTPVRRLRLRRSTTARNAATPTCCSDQRETERVTKKKQPGACLQCHASTLNTVAYRTARASRPAHRARSMHAFTSANGREQLFRRASRSRLCDALRANRPSWSQHPSRHVWIATTPSDDGPARQRGRVSWWASRALAANSDYACAAPAQHRTLAQGRPQARRVRPQHRMASRQEMRSFVCGQCHVEYYFKGDKQARDLPHGSNGLRMDDADRRLLRRGRSFSDWKNTRSPARPVLKAQHPEFEMWSQGIHARSGVACADCHMPYVREGAIKVSNHHVRSPLLNVAQACQTCHRVPEKEITARALLVQDRNVALLNRGEAAVIGLLDAIAAAQKAGATDAQLLGARVLHRKAQWRLDFISAENSMGFHAPQEAARILAEAIDYARQGELAVARDTKAGGVTSAQQ